jgi:hypothetical protein
LHSAAPATRPPMYTAAPTTLPRVDAGKSIGQVQSDQLAPVPLYGHFRGRSPSPDIYERWDLPCPPSDDPPPSDDDRDDHAEG